MSYDCEDVLIPVTKTLVAKLEVLLHTWVPKGLRVLLNFRDQVI